MERPRVYSDLPGFPQPEVEEQTLPSRARFSYNPYDTMNLTDGVPTLPPPLPEPISEPETSSTLPPPIPSRGVSTLPLSHGTPPLPSYGTPPPLLSHGGPTLPPPPPVQGDLVVLFLL